MNSSPIRLRLSSGSITPASLRQEPVRGLHVDERHAGSGGRTSPRPARARPRAGARYRRTRRSAARRSALWTRSAATAESTPPESAHSTSASPTCSRIRGHAPLDHVGRRPFGEQAAAVVEEPLHDRRPLRRVRDLGVELDGEQPALGVLHRGDRGSRRCESVTRKPSGARVTASPWLIQTGARSAARSLQQHPAARPTWSSVAAVLPLTGRRDLAAERLRHELVAVADAEDRDAELEHARVDRGRALLVHGRRAAGKDDPGRPLARRARPRTGRAARSRSRRGTRGSAGRSAARTAPRGRRRGPAAERSDAERHVSGPSPPAAPSGTSCPRS